ncbi:MAG: hypothetical protein AAB692_01260 [Patescibacteria group bacterium]
MPAERERTFLVAALPENLKAAKHADIEQFYITDEKGGLRMRKIDGRVELTMKLPIAGDNKDRNELDPFLLSEKTFQKLKKIADRHLKKRRYYVPIHDGLVAELDLYKDKLKGHRSVEVEFKSAKDKRDFAPPAWFGPEITNEAVGSNGFLAGKSYKQVKPLIDKLKAKK